MALKLKYKDEHGVLHINMSPSSSPTDSQRPDIADPKFDTINNRFGQYDLFGGKYDVEGQPSSEGQSLFRSRYNSVEEELANTPYAFATERLHLNNLDVTIESRGLDVSPSKDLEDDRFFNRGYDDLFGPELDTDPPAFTVTQLIHAQDRYFDLSSRQGSVDSPRVNNLSLEVSARKTDKGGAFKVLQKDTAVKGVQAEPPVTLPVVPTAKRKKESSFAILTETPASSRPTSPRSLPVEIRSDRRSPFKGRGFREETSRHNTPRTSAANSRASSPPRRRTNSLSRIDKMAQAAALPLPVHNIARPHSPRNFVKENIEEIRELSELNREKNEAEAERKRIEEEEALLKEMGLLDKNAKNDALKSLVGSRTTSRSNSPNKVNLRSRSNSPAAILHYENIPADSREFVNVENGVSKPVTHRSRLRSVSKSQPQSNEGSPKHSKIPKRQNSVSPARIGNKRGTSNSRRPVENGLKNQRFISNSTSSIHETIRIGSQVHDKRNMSKSTQFLDISSPHIKGKPPISPGRGGPPPSNKAINPKRLSPIVGTPNKSPVEDLKPSSAKRPTKPSPLAKKPVKTAGNTPATSRLTSRQPSRTVSRDHSPEKRKTTAKPTVSSKTTKSTTNKSVTRAPSTKTAQKPTINSKTEIKPPINRTSSMKSLIRTPSTKNLIEKPPLIKKSSKKDLTDKSKSTSKIDEVGTRKTSAREVPKSGKEKEPVKKDKAKEQDKEKLSVDSGTDTEDVAKQDNETQYDKITNEKGELVIMTKKNIVSMTTAAITSQPLEVVTTVTNQLPVALEKAREKGIFERLSSKESLMPKDEIKEKDTDSMATNSTQMEESKEIKVEVDIEKNKQDNEEKKPAKVEDKKPLSKPKEISTVFIEENIKLKPLQPPYNNPQVERVKQKIDEVLKSPEVSTENILAPAIKPIKETKKTFKSIASKTKIEMKESKDDIARKLTDIKDQVMKNQSEKLAAEMRSEATKIVDSIITPIEDPNKIEEKIKEAVKDKTETIITVVSEKKNGPIIEKMTETLVKGEPDVEVQSSNLSTPGDMRVTPKKMSEGNESDKSTHSNGGFPQSTSTTPKPPARTRKPFKDEKASTNETPLHPEEEEKKPNICSRLMGKCKTKCCPCCVKGGDSEGEGDVEEGKGSRWNCFKKKDTEDSPSEVERAAGKAATIEYENETHRKRSVRELLCGCCKRQRRVSDASALATRDVTPMSPGVVNETSCCGKRKSVERRDSILSDRPPRGCCGRMTSWARGAWRRRNAGGVPSSRRTSMFSKNKSMSPTLPPEDTRKKLDASLVEHTSMMKGAIPVLPIVLAYFCLLCNVLVPGLGTVLSGMFCVCFGIPRFGVHDGAKHRIGSLVINLVVGCGQLFTVLFCLVGWGWSIWWGVIMLRISRKYRKLKAEAAAAEEEAAPPVTANNHTSA